MKQLLSIFFLLLSLQLQAQNRVIVGSQGSTAKKDTAYLPGNLRVDSLVRLMRFADADTCKVLGIDTNGFVVLRDKCVGSVAVIDSNKFVTLTRLKDSLAAIRTSISGADSNVYSTVTRLKDSITALENRILAKGYLQIETDPTVPPAVKAITSTQINNWDNHLSNTSNPHSVTLDQAAKRNPVTDTSVYIGWQDPGGIISLFGNSITADIYTNPPPIPYYAHIANRHGQTFKVHAHGGATYYRGYTPHNNNGGLMDSVANLEVMPTIYSKLIIELGFNDGCQYATSYDTTQIKLSLDSFVVQADIKGWLRGSIGALSAWYIPNPALCNSMTDNDLIIINTAIQNECARLGIHYIDLHTLFANNQKRNLYFTDNVHWSSLGHWICADEVDREMYPQVYVKGNMLVDGVLYDNKGRQIIGIDTTGRKVIEGETGFDVLPDGKALVTVPFTKNYAGLRAGGVTFQGISTYNYFIGFNLHHNGTTYVTDTAGYSGMIQFADGEISYWQSTGSNTAGTAPTLEKRYKFSSNSRGFGFGGNPGNGGRDDFSGSAMQGDASKLQINFPTKIKYAPSNSDGQIQLLIRHITDSFIQVVTSIPYSFVSNRLKYANGNNYSLPVFAGSDTLINSHMQDSAGHIGIDTTATPNARVTIPISDSMAAALIGALYFGSLSANNIYISNNSYYRRGTGAIAASNGYVIQEGFYNSTGSGGASFIISASPYPQTAGQVVSGMYPFFKVTNWGSVIMGYTNSGSNTDSTQAALIVTNPTSTPNSASQVYFPTASTYSGTVKRYAVLDGSSSVGKIPNNKMTYVSTIPVADVTGAIDSMYRKPGTDSVVVRINGVWKFAFKDSTAAAGSSITSVTATSPMASSGGSTPNITIDTTASGGWHSYNYYKTVFANITHTHAESDITNLVTDLAGKQAALGFTPENTANKATSFSTINNTLFPTVQACSTYVANAIAALSSVYAPISHTHGMSDLTGFNINTPSDGQLMKYDFASGKWINFTPGYLTSVADATTSTKGIGSFSSSNFSVTSGAVSIKSGGVGSTEIADASVSLVDMANMATASVLGRNTAGTGVPEVLSMSTLKTMLSLTKTDVGLANVDNTSDAAKNSASATLTNKRITKRTISATSASSVTPDFDSYDMYIYTALAAGLTINAPTGTPVAGDARLFQITSDGSTHTLTWNAAFRSGANVTLPTSTTASKTLVVGFLWNTAASKWDCVTAIDGY